MLSLPVEGYRIRPDPSSLRVLALVGFGIPGLLTALFIANWVKYGRLDSTFLIITVLMTALLVFIAVRGRRELILRNDGFALKSVRVRDHPLSDFAGYRLTWTAGRYGNIRNYMVEGKSGHRNITLVSDGPALTFNPNDMRVLKQWLTDHLPDLEARDHAEETRERNEAKLLAGGHPLARVKARRIARVLNWTAFISALGCYVSLSAGLIHTPSIARLVAVAGLNVVPLTLAVKIWDPASFRFAERFSPGAPPSIDLGVVLGSLFALWVGCSFFQPLRWSSIVFPVGVASAVVCAVTFKFGLGRRDRNPGTIAYLAVFLALYGLGAILFLNGAFDSHRPGREDGLVVARSTSSGRDGRTYYWTIRFPGENGLERKISVPRRFYDMYNIRPQDPPVPVPVLIGPGALGIKWIRGFPI